MAFRISFVSDVREVLRGNEAMEKGFDQTADSLDDLARESKSTGDKIAKSLDDAGDSAKDAGNKIERELESATKEAGNEAEKLERKFRDAFDDVTRQSKKAGDDVGDNIKKGTREAEDGLSNFKDEANETARESAASFDGSADSIVDSFQEVAANAFGGFGPAAAVAGLAMAAGIGALWSSINENSETSKQVVSDMYQDMIESGQKFVSEQYLQQAIQDIIDSAEGAAISYEDLQEIAELTGISAADLARAYAGSAEDIVSAQQQIADKQDEIREKFGNSPLDDNARHTVGRLTDVSNALDDVAERTDTASAKASLYGEAVAGLPSKKVTDLEVNTQPGRMGMGDFYRDPNLFGRRSVDVGMNPQASTQQFQNEADRAARSVRPPVIQVRMQANGIQRAV